MTTTDNFPALLSLLGRVTKAADTEAAITAALQAAGRNRDRVMDVLEAVAEVVYDERRPSEVRGAAYLQMQVATQARTADDLAEASRRIEDIGVDWNWLRLYRRVPVKK